MRTVLHIAMMVSLVAFAGVACQTAPPPEPETAPAPTNEELLGALLGDFQGAWAQGDAAAVGALFAEDGDILTVRGHSRGRAEVEEGYRQLFEGPFKGTAIATQTTSVRLIQPDVALTDGTYEISGLKGADGADLPPVQGLFTGVNVNTADGWRMGCSRPMIPISPPDAS
jgi:uncharacterized protein (TIGR02246 family)